MAISPDVAIELKHFPCLSGLKDKELHLIAMIASLKKFSRNEYLFRISEPVRSFFIMREGTVKLFKTSSDGRELVIKIMHSGNYFCSAPIYGGGYYSVNAKVLEDSSIIIIPALEFKTLIKREIGELGLSIILGLCEKIRHLSNFIEELSFNNVEQRIAKAILNMAEERKPHENIVALAITHQEIASITGTVREVVSRIMLKFKKNGIIVESGVRGFKINKDRLSSIINNNEFTSCFSGSFMKSL